MKRAIIGVLFLFALSSSANALVFKLVKDSCPNGYVVWGLAWGAIPSTSDRADVQYSSVYNSGWSTWLPDVSRPSGTHSPAINDKWYMLLHFSNGNFAGASGKCFAEAYATCSFHTQ